MGDLVPYYFELFQQILTMVTTQWLLSLFLLISILGMIVQLIKNSESE